MRFIKKRHTFFAFITILGGFYFLLALLTVKPVLADNLLQNSVMNIDNMNQSNCDLGSVGCVLLNWTKWGSTQWQSDTFVYHSSPRSVKFSGGNENSAYSGGYSQTVNVTLGAYYTVSGWTQRYNGNGSNYVGVQFGPSGAISWYKLYGTDTAYGDVFGSMYQFSITVAATSNTMTVYMVGGTNPSDKGNQSDVYFDDLDVSLVNPQPCTGFNNFDTPPNTNDTLVYGSTYRLYGWATFCSGTNGTNRDRVDVHLCPQNSWSSCTALGTASSEVRSGVEALSWTCGNYNTNDDGWFKDWTVNQTAGNYTLRVASINDPATTCVKWSSKNISIACPAADSCGSATCQTTKASVPNGSCGVTECSANYCATSCSTSGTCCPAGTCQTTTAGCSSFCNASVGNYCNTSGNCVAVNAPISLTGSCPAPGTSAALSWTAATGVDGYEVKVPGSTTWTSVGNSTSYTWTGVTTDTTYAVGSWQVRAYKVSTYSAAVDGASFTCFEAPSITSLQIGNNPNIANAFTSNLKASGRQTAQSGQGWYNPMTITLNATAGTGTISDYYVAFYDNTLTQAATKSTFLADVQAKLKSADGTAAKRGFLLKYKVSNTKYYVWDYSVTINTDTTTRTALGAIDCNASGCFIETTSINARRICGKNVSGVQDCTNKLYYTVYPGSFSNSTLANTWRVLLDANFGSKTLYTAGYVLDDNNLSDFNANLTPAY